MLAEEDWFYVQIEARVVDTGLDRSVNLRDENWPGDGESFEGSTDGSHKIAAMAPMFNPVRPFRQ